MAAAARLLRSTCPNPAASTAAMSAFRPERLMEKAKSGLVTGWSDRSSFECGLSGVAARRPFLLDFQH